MSDIFGITEAAAAEQPAADQWGTGWGTPKAAPKAAPTAKPAADDGWGSGWSTPKAAAPGVVEDTTRGFGGGVTKGTQGIAESPGVVADLASAGLRKIGVADALKWAGEKTGWWDPNEIAGSEEERQAILRRHGINDANKQYTIGDVGKMVAGGLGEAAKDTYLDPTYKPQSMPGVVAQRVGEFVPAMVPGGAAGAIPRAVLPAVGSLAGEGIGEKLGHPVIGNIIGTVAGSLANPVASAALAPRVTPEVAAAAERQGVTMPAAMATESELAGKAATGLAKAPVIGAPLNYAASKAEGQIGEAAARAAAEGGATTTAEAGDALRDAMKGWKTGASRKQVSDAYDALESKLQPNASGQLTQTRQEAGNILAERHDPGLGKGPAVELVESALQNPRGLSYTSMQRLRSAVIDKIDAVEPGSYELRELVRVKDALTKDIEQHVQQVGQPGALDAWNAANKVAADVAGRRAAVNDIIGISKEASGEQVAAKIGALAGTGRGADIGALNKAKSTVGQADWDQIAGSIAQRAFTDANGAFSPKQFVKWYDGLSDAGKQNLFGNTGQGLRQAYDDISALSKRAAASGLSSVGRTGGAAGVAAEVGAAALFPAAALKTAGIAMPLSVLLARPATASKAAYFIRTAQELSDAQRLGKVSSQLMRSYQAAQDDLRVAAGGPQQ